MVQVPRDVTVKTVMQNLRELLAQGARHPRGHAILGEQPYADALQSGDITGAIPMGHGNPLVDRLPLGAGQPLLRSPHRRDAPPVPRETYLQSTVLVGKTRSRVAEQNEHST
jgi:hypothetical protein